MKSSGNPICDALANFEIRGNLVHDEWCKTILTESGKTKYLAVFILSEVIYWYRPKILYDSTGIPCELKKKFHADRLQKSYSELAEKFHAPKSSVRDALKDLERLEVVTREFRTITVAGVKCVNVMYLKLNANRLAELSAIPPGSKNDSSPSEGTEFSGEKSDEVLQEKHNTSSKKSENVTDEKDTTASKKPAEVTDERDNTNTESTQESPSEVSAEISSSSVSTDEDEIYNEACDELEISNQIPDSYRSDPRRLKAFIHLLCDLPPDHYSTALEREAYRYAVNGLLSLAENSSTKLKNIIVNRDDFIDHINHSLSSGTSFCEYLDTIVSSYCRVAENKTIVAPSAYMRMLLWKNFETYRGTILSELNRM